MNGMAGLNYALTTSPSETTWVDKQYGIKQMTSNNDIYCVAQQLQTLVDASDGVAYLLCDLQDLSCKNRYEFYYGRDAVTNIWFETSQNVSSVTFHRVVDASCVELTLDVVRNRDRLCVVGLDNYHYVSAPTGALLAMTINGNVTEDIIINYTSVIAAAAPRIMMLFSPIIFDATTDHSEYSLSSIPPTVWSGYQHAYDASITVFAPDNQFQLEY